MKITCPVTRADLHWWISHCHVPKPISCGNPDIIIQMDASKQGWMAVMLTQPIQQTGGRWDFSEKQAHINVLELRAAFLGLQAFKDHIRGKHVLVEMDNNTAVSYIGKMGGSKSGSCNNLAKIIWTWCIEKQVWLTATFLPGIENTLADKESRSFNDRTEWALKQEIFESICRHFQERPEIDLFASRLNTKLPNFCAWRSDPNACAINAFTVAWNYNLTYLFPPFSVLAWTLQKLRQDQTDAIIIAPHWPTQPCFAMLLQLKTLEPLPLPCAKSTLYLPHQPDLVHPLWKKLKLMAWRISGKT